MSLVSSNVLKDFEVIETMDQLHVSAQLCDLSLVSPTYDFKEQYTIK